MALGIARIQAGIVGRSESAVRSLLAFEHEAAHWTDSRLVSSTYGRSSIVFFVIYANILEQKIIQIERLVYILWASSV